MLINTHGDKDAITANAAIRDFFDCYTLPDAIQVLERIISASCRSKAWKGKSPFHVLFFTEHLQHLFAAAAVLQQRYAQNKKGILPLPRELHHIQPQHYCNHAAKGNNWHWFPRHLGRKKYCNPYMVLQQFTKLYPVHKSSRLAATLAEYALSNYAIDEEYNSLWVLQARCRLLQLIEACHLILVRTQDTAINKKPKHNHHASP